MEAENANDVEGDAILPLRGEGEVPAQTSMVEGEIPNNEQPTPGAASTPHRPLTRSQTGRVPKRRRRDETPPPAEVRKKPSAPRKKPKPSVKPVVDSEDEDALGEEYTETPSPEGSGSEVVMTLAQMPLQPNTTQLTFMDGLPSSMVPIDRRGPRSRAVLPVPVPNLTKKSRGRRVPIKLATDGNSDKEMRLYVCKVESCGKCFHRGEHLKRHIRSIHTHEKPFECSYPSCDKRFNRHDNLLQHLKVHKGPDTTRSSHARESESPKQAQQKSSPPSPPPPPPQKPLQPYVYPPVNEAYEASINQARMAAAFHQPVSFMTYTASYSSTSEPTSFATNMAVSSLRTEIPHSPTSRKYDVSVHQHYPVSFAS